MKSYEACGFQKDDIDFIMPLGFYYTVTVYGAHCTLHCIFEVRMPALFLGQFQKAFT